MTTLGQTFHLLVPDAFAGQRLDKFLADALPKTSRNVAQRLLELGHVSLRGQPCNDASRKLAAGDALKVFIPPAEPSELKPANIPLEILFEDSHLLVINKQAGLTVHPAPGEKGPTLVHALLHHCGKSLSGIGGVARPGIVHRLDKETSGAMLVAKNDAAHQSLSAQLQDRTLSRCYHAIVWGVPQPTSGTWEGAIGRSPANRKKMAVVKQGGKEARTHYKVVEVFPSAKASLLALKLETGRTHQIRVHASHHGYPLLGDPTYGRRRENDIAFTRQALHAAEISFRHPASDEILTFTAPAPADFSALLATLRG